MSILNMLLGGGAGGGDVITEFETGTFAPASMYDEPIIPFVNVHTEPPVIVLLADDTGLRPAASMEAVWFFADWAKIFGGPLLGVGDGYGEIRNISYYQNYNEIGFNSATASQTYVTSSQFSPKINSVFYDNTRTYKWIALWMPSE